MLNIRFTTLSLTLLLLQLSCSPVPESKILEFANSAQLATAEYTVKKVVRTSDSEWFTIGDRKMVFSVTAHIKAGIDLSNLTPDKVQVDRNSVTLTLPHAKLISFDLPIEETVLEYQQVGMFRSDFTAEERNSLLTFGEESIRRDTAIMDGVIKDAEDNASSFFKTALLSLGFSEVLVKFE